MIYLILAIISSAMISVLMRISEKYISNNVSLLAVNYVTCSVLAALYAGPAQLIPSGNNATATLGLGAVSGIFFLSGFLMMQWNISKNGVVMTATFMKLGVLVPITMSVIVFRETPGIPQLLGYVGALSAILMIHFDGSKNDTGRAKSRLALILLLLIGGLGDTMPKICEQVLGTEMGSHFLFYNFFTALILCTALIFIKKQRLGKWELLFGFIIGIPNYFSTRFLLLSLNTVPAVIAYPTYSVSTLVVIALAGLLFFREKLSRRHAIAMGIILVSLALLNL